MWLLMLIMFIPDAAISRTELARFATEGACQSERDRIQRMMGEAYPNENDFILRCKYRVQLIKKRRPVCRNSASGGNNLPERTAPCLNVSF